MTEKDDQDWVHGLAGKPPPDSAVATAAEARAVREAMLRAQREEQPPDFELESGLQQLLFRLREQKLLEPERARPWRRVYPMLAAAAGVAIIGIGILQLAPERDSGEPVYRGGTDAAQVLTTAEPAKLAAEIASDLSALGVQALVSEFGRTARVEAEWAQKPDERHAAFLKRYGLTGPTAGRLRIEIRSAP
jgi:hypothetical protein